jgi:hypothetical protein
VEQKSARIKILAQQKRDGLITRPGKGKNIGRGLKNAAYPRI